MKIHIDNYENDRQRSNKCSTLKTTICFLSFWRFLALTFTLFVGFVVLLLCKTYIKMVLLWLENHNGIFVSIWIIFLFVLVSLPFSLGYIVLVLADGYLFGIFKGVPLAVFGANFGLLIAHNLLKLVGHHRSVYKFTQNDTAQAIMRVISGPLCFKIVFCSRLTPIPFGLQNTIFALSNVNTKIYHLASLLGLLPAQLVGVYVGTTLRSMQDVFDNRHMSSTTYIFISVQLMLAAYLMVWFSAKARAELMKALDEANGAPHTKAVNYSIV